MSEQLQHQPLQSAADYEAALDALLAKAQRTIRIFDHTLERGYNSVKRCDTLRSFLLAGRLNRIYIVVHDTDNIVRDCPRLMLLLKQFNHSMTIHETHPHVKGIGDTFVAVDDSHYLHRFHYDDTRGLLAFNDVAGARQLIERFDDISDASFPAVFATTLGL